jgi:hypothetical protein
MSDFEAYNPEPSKELEEAVQREQGKVIASLPVIQDVLDWFDEQIAGFKDPMIISNVSEGTDANEVKDKVLAAQKDIIRYEKKKAEFMNRFSKYLESADA